MQLPSNYFELLGFSEAFQLDLSELEQKFRALQREYHPDRYAHESEATQLKAVQAATLINEAYQSLKSPVRRAQYLLQLRGIEAGEESRKQLPLPFLMEQMELRERLADAASAADPFQVLEELQGEARTAIAQELQRFDQAFQDHELETAEESVRKLQFLSKLQTEIESAEERFDEEF